MINEDKVAESTELMSIRKRLLYASSQMEKLSLKNDTGIFRLILGDMIELTSKAVEESYIKVNPQYCAKVKARFEGFTTTYLNSIELGRKLLEAIHLARYIVETKMGRLDKSLRIIDSIMEKVHNYKLENKHIHLSTDSRNHNSYKSTLLYSTNAPAVSVLPKHNFVKAKTDSVKYSRDALKMMMWQQFMLPDDSMLVKELISSDFVCHYLTLDELHAIVKVFSEDYRLNRSFELPRPTYFTMKVDSIMEKVVRSSLLKYSSKLSKVFSDIELILRECLAKIELSGKVIPQTANKTSIAESSRMAISRKESLFTSRPAYQPSCTFKQSRSPIIKTLSKTWDRYHALQKRDNDTDILRPDNNNADEDEDSRMNLDDVNKLIKEEKLKSYSNQGLNTGSTAGKAQPNVDTNPAVSLFRQRDFFSNQLKEIMGFGTTLRSLKQCLDKQTLTLLPLHTMPSIMDAKVKNKNTMHQLRKVMFTIQNPVSQHKHDASPTTSTDHLKSNNHVFSDRQYSPRQHSPSTPLHASARHTKANCFLTSRKSQPAIRHIDASHASVTHDKVSAGKLFFKNKYSTPDCKSTNRSNQSSSYQISSVRYSRRQSANNMPNTRLSARDATRMNKNIDQFILSPQ